MVSAALATKSVALAGFGLDSLIEIGASTIVIWHLRGAHAAGERQALRLIAIAFFALAAYIFLQSVYTVVLRIHPGTSPLGILWLGLTLGVMLALAAGKHRTGVQLDNPVLITEARVTLIDASLAGATLFGVALDAVLGWWWADPAVGAVLIVYGLKEGRHAWAESRAAP